jgi:hypothetical protein
MNMSVEREDRVAGAVIFGATMLPTWSPGRGVEGLNAFVGPGNDDGWQRDDERIRGY